MSLADKYFIENCRDIIEHGSWDTNSEVRPRWEDGTPAHTVKKFCVVNRYNLQEEFPVMTLRRIYYRSAIEEMGLAPCAYSMTFNVTGDTLNAILNQRSQDMLTANNWNVCQYAALLIMFAKASGLKAGELVHVIADAHIYDRHIDAVKRIIEKEPYPAPEMVVEDITDFYKFTKNSFTLKDYKYHDFDEKIEVAI